MKKLLLLFIFFAAFASSAAVRFAVTPACQDILTGVGPEYSVQINRLISGRGIVKMFAPQDLAGDSVPEPLRGVMSRYLDLEPRSHQALFYLLPDSAGHLFETEATTYLDNPTSHFKVSQDGVWLAFEIPDPGAREPLHKVVLHHSATDTSIAHETLHLEDLEEVFIFVEANLGTAERLIIRQDLFRYATELIVYKKTYRVFQKRGSETISVQNAVRSMEGDFIPALQALKKSERDIILKAFGIKNLSSESLASYIANRDAIPDVMSVLLKFDSDGMRVVKK